MLLRSPDNRSPCGAPWKWPWLPGDSTPQPPSSILCGHRPFSSSSTHPLFPSSLTRTAQFPWSSELKSVQLNPGGRDSDTHVGGGARNQQYLVCGAWLHPSSLATCSLELEDKNKNKEAAAQPVEPPRKVRGLPGAEATTSSVPDCLNRFYFLILSVYSIDQRANIF